MKKGRLKKLGTVFLFVYSDVVPHTRKLQMKENYKVILISMSGVRVYNKRLLELGLTLPGFVERSEVIASLPSLGLLTLASHTPENWTVIYKELDNFSESDNLK